MDKRFQFLLQIKEISLSELARCSRITPGYLSKIINGKSPNVSVGALVRISERINLPTEELYRMIKDKSYMPESLNMRMKDIVPPSETFEDAVQKALDAVEASDHKQFQFWSERARLSPSPLQKCYESWFEGLQLAYENLYDLALEKFLAAQQFKARSAVERRFKAKVLFGIGSLYLGKGNYKMSLAMFRKSLLTWEEEIHAGTIYLNMGTLNRRNGAYQSAELCYRSALSISVDFIQLLAYAGLGQLYIDQKRFPEARFTLLQGYCLAKKSSGDRGKGELFCNLGKYYKEICRIEIATKLLKRGLTYTKTPSSKRTRQFLLTELIDAYSISKESEIEPMILDLLNEGFAEGDVFLVGSSLLTAAKECIKNNRILEAVTLLHKCYRLLSQIYPSEELVSSCQLLSECFQVLKEPYQSEFFLRELKRLKKLLNTKE